MSRKGLYEIPKAGDVLRISIEILEEYGIVSSLKMLTKLVNMRARTENSRWRIGPQRLRKIVALSKKVEIDVITKETGERLEGDVRCMICGEQMQPEMNRTLDGDTVVLGYTCRNCGYRTGVEKKAALRYTFRLR